MSEQKENTCKDCRHFRAHYVKFGKRYNKIRCGHCVEPRLKQRYSETKACEKYSERKEE